MSRDKVARLWLIFIRSLLSLIALCALGLGCREDPITLPPPAEPAIDSPEAVIEALARAYQERDPELLESLLANDPAANATYTFFLSEYTNRGEDRWGHDEEVRIHWRMFQPDSPQAGAPPVPTDFRVQSVRITLTQITDFRERPDLYSADNGLDGKLLPSRWRAMGATYSTYVLWDMQQIQLKVEGDAYFVVIEDLTKAPRDEGKHLLYIWGDVAPPQPVARAEGVDGKRVVSSATWSNVKQLYR